MILQDRLELQGKHHCYLLKPNDPAFILKPNGEVCSTFIALAQGSGQKVVVKRYHPNLYKLPEYFNRILREAEATAAYSNNHSELIFQDGVYHLVYNYIEGVNLIQLTKCRYRRKFSKANLLQIAAKALGELHKLHASGYVHCDIKPANIIVSVPNTGSILDGQVRLIDFGLARKPAEPITGKQEKLPFSLIYSAPEQILNLWELVSYQTDIYAMGVTLWQLFARTEPWKTNNPLKTIHVQLTQPLPKSSRLPEGLEEILQKATSKVLLPKPPHYYSRLQLKEMLVDAINRRYSTTEIMRSEIETLIKK